LARDLVPQPLRVPPKPPAIDEGRHKLPHDAEDEDGANNGHEPGSSSFSTGPVVGSDSANQGSDNRISMLSMGPSTGSPSHPFRRVTFGSLALRNRGMPEGAGRVGEHRYSMISSVAAAALRGSSTRAP